ncbi:MAG: penicillin-binding protein [Bacteroidales bacterium]|nr:penicillin-binding protein [Bacteroidales bacterium]MDD2813945.1 penicillin-binding protein [Bacteroidales bacterium]
MLRVGIVYLIFALVALVILGQVLYIQTVEGPKWRKEAEELAQRPQVIKASRGEILDRNGFTLASSLPRYTVAMDPSSSGMQDSTFNKYLPDLAAGLANLWPEKKAHQYEQMIRKGRIQKDQYLVIRRNVSFTEAKKVARLPLFELGQFKGGLLLEPVFTRELPYKLLAKRTIGYESKDEQGQHVGLEGAFDYFLKGRDGFRMEYNIGAGRWAPLRADNDLDPIDGLDVVTTIDVHLQDVAETALYQSLTELEAQHGCAVLMEVATGEILAIANLTRYPDGHCYEDKNHALLDRSDPGSTFKIPVIMTALEDGLVKPTDTVNTFNGRFVLDRRTITDSHRGGYQVITVQEVIEKSSNIGMARLINRYYRNNPDHFIERLYGMGLDIPLDLEIKGVREPIIKSTATPSWSIQTLASMSFGYETEFVPLQILNFYNAIANDGVMVKPRLVKALMKNSQVYKTYPTEVIKSSICSNETLRTVRSMLEGVVQRGTGTNLKDSLYTIAGKTGTAVINESGRWVTEDGRRRYRASFVGYFPADNPKYSCIVVVAKPTKGNSYYGGIVAGGVFKAIADKVYATNLDLHGSLKPGDLGKTVGEPTILPGAGSEVKQVVSSLKLNLPLPDTQDELIELVNNENQITIQKRIAVPDSLPNVQGLGLKDALPVLENLGFRVSVKGSGRILAQSPAPGTPRDSVRVVELQLAAL